VQQVAAELEAMGLVDIQAITCTQQVSVRWANVIFTHDTKPALEAIWTWLEGFGLTREEDDLHPLTDWTKQGLDQRGLGPIAFSGRYGQWKYFWTDDCVLRGKTLAAS
jgi:hypothetical protein